MVRRPSKPTHVIAYLRCSTEGQADEGMSLDVQRERIAAYCALYGLTVTAWERDVASGSSTRGRPGLRRALEALDEGQADGLVVAALDRLTRSVTDLGSLIGSHFGRAQGPALLSVGEQIDTRSAAGRMILNVLASVSQWERERLVERTVQALRVKRVRRERLGGHVPYGKALAPDGIHLVDDPAEQALIARASALRAEGLGLRRIAAKLTEEGYTTRKGTPLQTTQIARMLGPSEADAEA
jgi:DNA invertase Pin-like site-specific DNA recombinase